MRHDLLKLITLHFVDIDVGVLVDDKLIATPLVGRLRAWYYLGLVCITRVAIMIGGVHFVLFIIILY